MSAYLFVFGGFSVALIGIVIGTVVILHHHRNSASGRPAPMAVHVLGMLATGVLAGILGMNLGIWHFCLVPGAGAQCGFGGVFVTGPIAFGLGAIAYAIAYASWRKKLS